MAAVRHFILELRRRRVFRTLGVYVVAAWALLQVCDLAFASFGLPGEALRYVWLAAIAGLPLALVFGWRYDITADGIRRTPATAEGQTAELGLRGPDYAILASLGVLALVFAATTAWEIRSGPMRAGGAWYESERFATGIAVLPLENLSGDEGQRYLAAGLHDTLISTLSRITRFRVTSRFSTQRIDAGLPLAEIASRLAVDTILSGSVLREADQVRINVTLFDAKTENPLWSDSFTREFDGLIAVQNEIASTVAREVKLRLTPEEERRLTAAGEGPDAECR